MSGIDVRDLPLDPISTQALASRSLAYRRVDAGDRAAARAYADAEARGFLGGELSDEEADEFREGIAYRRWIGVYDEAGYDPGAPVATVNSWGGELTVPGERTTPFWAISGVTVSATRRRRGIARAMLAGELRTAHAAGFAVAGLTVSEATIYGRFGFAPAVRTADWEIDARRAGWRGAEVGGTLDYVARTEAVELLALLHDRTRLRRPGDVDGWAGRWRQFASVARGSEHPGRTRVVRYADEQGAVRGAVAYRLTEEGAAFSGHTLDVTYLVADGDDAYAALWGFVLQHDLVSRVRAPLRSTDEALLWLLGDQRAATVTVRDHEWLRILDVPAALEARTFPTPGSIVLGIRDDLGFAGGSWRLDVASGGEAGVVVRTDVEPDVTMPVASLAALYLGGASAPSLGTAGQLAGSPEAITHLGRMFASGAAPTLGIWY